MREGGGRRAEGGGKQAEGRGRRSARVGAGMAVNSVTAAGTH